MKLLLVFTIFLSTSFAKVCSYTLETKGSKLGWKAFKTAEKVGVGASFTDFSIITSRASSIEALLSSAAFHINALSVNSGNEGRDKKIEKFFFSPMKGGAHIKGFVSKVKPSSTTAGVAEVELNMNGKTEDVQMNYTYKEGILTLSSSIDVLKWALDGSLKAINQACYALHKGKTWNDVELLIEGKIKESCK